MMNVTRLVLVLTLCVLCACKNRDYYIATVEVDWNYAPLGGSQVKDPAGLSRQFLETASDRIGGTYRKAVYVQFTDATFSTEVKKPQWLGLVGPVLKGETGDTITVYYKNLATRPYSVHPHGVFYNKSSEGALYSDSTKGSDKLDDEVPPGGEHMYVWEVKNDFAPAKEDEPCIPWAYHSHGQNVPRDLNTGLIGVILTCKQGVLDKDDSRTDVDKEFVVLMKIFDENVNWYMNDNLKRCGDPASCRKLAQSRNVEFEDSNRMHALNGYVYGNGPKFETCVGDKVAWHIIGMGNEEDVHTFMVDGESLIYNNHRTLVVDVYPAKFAAAEMVARTEGARLLYCKVNDHFDEGMQAFLSASTCPGKTAARTEGGHVRQIFLGIHEEVWNYLPSGVDKLSERPLIVDSGTEAARYFVGRADRIGSQYKKARFFQYQDEGFKIKKQLDKDENHLGILGPIIRVEAGQTLEVHLMNNATRPFSFHAPALVQPSQPDAQDGSSSDGTLPGHRNVYRFYVPPSAGPTGKDTACVTSVYQSAVDPVRDINSGLFGPLLICKPRALDAFGKQRTVDKDRVLYFGVVDENRSWYLEENIGMFCVPSRVNRTDPDFQESNRMRGVNGRSFGNLGGLNLCRGERVSWHLFSLGSQTDVHSVYFHGMDLDFDGSLRDTLELVPGMGLSFITLMRHIGKWGIFDRNTDDFRTGMSALYQVKNCGYAISAVRRRARPFKRQFYIAAVEREWDYAPSKTSVRDESRLDDPSSNAYVFVRDDSKHIGSIYKKALYQEFRDSSFTVPKHINVDDDYLGLLGPVIRAEVGERVEIVFKNMASKAYSIHAHLVHTDKASEGSLYSDATETKTDDGVAPGGFQVYKWDITQGPGPSDPPCISTLYYSAHDQVRDAYTGLIGPLIICRKGILANRRERKDVDKEFILLFSIMDENQSWYLKENQQKYAPDRRNLTDENFLESNRMHMINGFIYQQLPGLLMHIGNKVAWHILGFGGTHDIHTVHFHGQSVLSVSGGKRRVDVLTVFPETGVSVVMNATNPGVWLLHCHVNDHMDAGMETKYTILGHQKP